MSSGDRVEEAFDREDAVDTGTATPPAEAHPRFPGLRGDGRWSRVALVGLLVDLVAVLACGFDAARLSKGMDVSWDLLNYHYYYSYLLFHGGIGQADPEPFINRFLNPLPELPWYLFDRAFDPRLSSAMIGLVAGLNLPLIRRITLRLLPRDMAAAKALALSVVAVVVAAGGAVFRMEIGTSLADVVVSLPLLAALLMVLRGVQDDPDRAGPRRWLPYAIAGALAGVATGAKLTMLTYSLALAVAVAVLALRRRRPSILVAHVGGIAVGVGASSGWWFWSVWRVTGNPVFPFYNSIFHSADWSGPDFHDNRYRPHGLLDAVKYPFYMFKGTRRVLDVPVRDPRWVVLLVLLAAALAVAVVRLLRSERRGQGPRALVAGVVATVLDAQALLVFGVFAVIGSVLWLWQFGIVRYGVTSELLVGPAAALLLLVVVRRAVLAAVLALAMAAAMFPFVRGHFLHVPFQRDRYMVQAGPLQRVPAGSVVLSDAGSGPNSFLLTYLPKGVRRHIVHPAFYGKPLLRKLERAELAPARHIYLLETSAYRKRIAILERDLRVRLEPSTCRPIRSSVKVRYICAAQWLGAAAVTKGKVP